MPKNKDAYEYVTQAGLIASHDVEAVEAIYPGSFDASVAAHTPKFAATSDPKLAREHLGALIAADLWEKRGGRQVSEDTDARIQSAKSQAEAWLLESRAPKEAPRPVSHAPSANPSKSDS
jgi:hypothetical protein